MTAAVCSILFIDWLVESWATRKVIRDLEGQARETRVQGWTMNSISQLRAGKTWREIDNPATEGVAMLFGTLIAN